MGCDGGTIPRRDELVKTKKKPESVSKFILLFGLLKNISLILGSCLQLFLINFKTKNILYKFA